MNKEVFFLSNIISRDFTRGVTKKVFGQIKGIEKNGYTVRYYTGYVNDGVAVFKRNGDVVYKKSFRTKNKFICRITRNQLLKKTAAEFMNQSNEQFSLCYARYLFSDPAFINFLKTAKKYSNRILVEAHSYPLYLKCCPQLYLTYAIDFIWNKKVKKYTDYVISIPDGYDSIWGVKTIHVDNGIDPDLIGMKKDTAAAAIRLVAVAYEWAPHGYDRIIKGLRNYYDGKPKKAIIIKLVGTVMRSTEKLISDLHMEEYVQIVGKRYGKELDEIYDNSDIGVGSLASFRAGISGVACELKTREYIAKGLPYLCTGRSEEESWYNCVFPADNDPIDMNKVVEFYEKLKKVKDCSLKIRNESDALTWTAQFKKIFEVIENDKSTS